jgi:putative endonuclease
MYYLYILYSESSDIYYVGHTGDVEQRLKQHNELAGDSFTSKHRPWVLKAVFSCGENRGVAMRVEKFVKKQKSKAFIKALIQGVPLTGILAPLVRVPHMRDKSEGLP